MTTMHTSAPPIPIADPGRDPEVDGLGGLQPPSVGLADTIRAGVASLAARRLRTLLSAMGIAIGIASLVAVMGLSASNRAQLLAELDRLGTNLFSVRGALDFNGGSTSLPLTSAAQLERLGGVEAAATTREIPGGVRRSPDTSRGAAPGISAAATQTNLLGVVGAELATGRFLDASTGAYDNVVLGALAAERLGVDRAGVRVRIDDRWMTVIGILEPATLAPDLDALALIGEEAAARYFDDDRPDAVDPEVDVVYLRADPASLEDVRSVIGSTLRPTSPQEVAVERPSDALEATALAESAFNALFLGLGAVALTVGGIGVANVMVIAVMERRNEIGLRRSLGATRSHIRRQFIFESLLLSAIGGLIGIGLGAAVTAAWATNQGWLVRIPLIAVGGGLGAALVVGAGAGLYPAIRAARLSPVDALRT